MSLNVEQGYDNMTSSSCSVVGMEVRMPRLVAELAGRFGQKFGAVAMGTWGRAMCVSDTVSGSCSRLVSLKVTRAVPLAVPGSLSGGPFTFTGGASTRPTPRDSLMPCQELPDDVGQGRLLAPATLLEYFLPEPVCGSTRKCSLCLLFSCSLPGLIFSCVTDLCFLPGPMILSTKLGYFWTF